MTATILTSVFAHGGRTSRYGDFTVVLLHGCSFITTPMEFLQNQNWARGRTSCGNAVRDRSAFVDRFENVLARSGSGLATKGSRAVLSRIVKGMQANAMVMEEWSIPHNVHESVEIQRRPPKAAVPAAAGAGPEAPAAPPAEPAPRS